jgi:hypothetical protein
MKKKYFLGQKTLDVLLGRPKPVLPKKDSTFYIWIFILSAFLYILGDSGWFEEAAKDIKWWSLWAFIAASGFKIAIDRSNRKVKEDESFKKSVLDFTADSFMNVRLDLDVIKKSGDLIDVKFFQLDIDHPSDPFVDVPQSNIFTSNAAYFRNNNDDTYCIFFIRQRRPSEIHREVVCLTLKQWQMRLDRLEALGNQVKILVDDKSNDQYGKSIATVTFNYKLATERFISIFSLGTKDLNLMGKF